MSKWCVKSDNITATNLDDAKPTQLAPDAERNYLHLRRQLETIEVQYLGLKERLGEIYKHKINLKNACYRFSSVDVFLTRGGLHTSNSFPS